MPASGRMRKNRGDVRPSPREGDTVAEALRRASLGSMPRPVSSVKMDLKKNVIGNPRIGAGSSARPSGPGPAGRRPR